MNSAIKESINPAAAYTTNEPCHSMPAHQMSSSHSNVSLASWLEDNPASTAEKTENRLSEDAAQNKRQASLLMEEEVKPYELLPNQGDVAGCRDLVDLKKVMEIYRKYRDDPSRRSSLDVVNICYIILLASRQRAYILRPVITQVRNLVMEKQNEVLRSYLLEIADDGLNGRCGLSPHATMYMLTALAGVNANRDATRIWTQMRQHKDYTNVASVPRVVGAALTTVDPSESTLEEIEEAYTKTVEKYHSHVLLDEALANGYLRFKEFEKASALYSFMCQRYNMMSLLSTFTRLHNRILTDCSDLKIAKEFFESAVEPSAPINLHPAAVTSYVRNTWESEKSESTMSDIINIYIKAVKHFAANRRVSPRTYNMLTTEVMKKFVEAYPMDNEAGRNVIRDMLDRYTEAVSPPPVLILNTITSLISKQWPESDFIKSLQTLVEDAVSRKNEKLGHDSLRILLNSSQGIDVDAIKINHWWSLLGKDGMRDYFDWLAFATACNHPDRVETFINELMIAVGPDGQRLPCYGRLISKAKKLNYVRRGLEEARLDGRLPEAPGYMGYDTSTLQRELNS